MQGMPNKFQLCKNNQWIQITMSPLQTMHGTMLYQWEHESRDKHESEKHVSEGKKLKSAKNSWAFFVLV